MLDHIMEHSLAVVGWDWRLSVLATMLSIFLVTRIVTTFRSMVALKAFGQNKTPPIVPYSIPMVGNLISFAFNSMKFLDWMRNTYGPTIAVQFRVMNLKLHYVSGADNVLALFRGSRDLTTTPLSVVVLENAFGSPPSVSHFLTRDKTGVQPQPLKGVEKVEPHNRFFHIMHKHLHNHLNGKSLAVLGEKFSHFMRGEIDGIKTDAEGWTEVPDLYRLIQFAVFTASTKALCGPHIFDLNPDLASDFWSFDSHVPNLFKLLPRWLIPAAYRVRDKMHKSIAKWHSYAEENFDTELESVEPQDWESYYGHRLMRDRMIGYKKMDGYNAEARAANDLGMVWAANANVVPAVSWMVMDILARPELLATIQREINESKSVKGLDIPKLLTQPYLQSVYSEELRLRTAVAIQRIPIVDNFKIGPWSFPRDQMILASSWHEHRDTTIWNEGPVNGITHPVDDFWAARFLIYPDDPNSGPRKPNAKTTTKIQFAEEKEKGKIEDSNKPIYTVEPVHGSYLPYGGGLKMCPGRFYAKQEIIVAVALFLDNFSFESAAKVPKPNMAYFAFGLAPPLDKFPVRMKRKQV